MVWVCFSFACDAKWWWWALPLVSRASFAAVRRLAAKRCHRTGPLRNNLGLNVASHNAYIHSLKRT